MLVATLANVAVILMGYLVLQALFHFREFVSRFVLEATIVVVVLVLIICLFYLPIVYGEFRFDLRLIPLLFLALFFGWRLTIPVVMLASLWRYVVIGGAVAVPAIVFATVIPTLFVLLFYQKRVIDSFKLKYFFIVSFCWLLSDLPVIVAMENGWQVFKEIGAIRYVSFIVVATMIHGLIINEIKRVRLQERLTYYANYCPLTGVRIRSSFLELAAAYFERPAKRRSLALGMIDIDRFKLLNDTYGHLAGDLVLERLGDVFQTFESEDVVFGRYGGDEFIILFCGLDAAKTGKLIEDLQVAVSALRVPFEGAILTVTISVGVHTYESEESLQELIHGADHQMYVNKLTKDELIVQ